MKVALYARVSDKSQDPLSQVPRLQAWAMANGHDVVVERVEIASTRLTRRPLREEIMQEARGRHVQAVAVAKLDRWGRSLIDIKTSLAELQRLGCHFYAIDQGISLHGKEDPMAGFLLNVMGAFAELERDLISERTKQGMAYARSQGKHVGRPKKGYPPGYTPVGPDTHPSGRVPFPRSENSPPSEKSTPREVTP